MAPIKRGEFLKPLSRDHHHALLLVWKIRKGFKKNIDIVRVNEYVQWFYQNHLAPHIVFEEKFIYPILPKADKNLLKALDDHEILRGYFTTKVDITIEQYLGIADLLEQHIRFEERVLFNQIQDIANEEQRNAIENNVANARFIDNEKDKFWE